jgi:hypothetical protein
MKTTINGTEVFGTPTEMKELLGTTKKVAKVQSKTPVKKRITKPLKRWTDDDDQMVRDDYNRMIAISVTAKRIGKTESAVRQRQSKLGITRR